MEIRGDTREDEIRLEDYLRVIGKHKGLISGMIAVAVMAALVASFVMRPFYEANAVIAPAVKSSEQGGLTGVGAIASQLGINPPSSSNIWEIINLLKSDVLKERMIRKHNLLPVLLTGESMTGRTDEEATWAGIRRLHKATKVAFNQRENAIRISVTFEEPRMAAELLSLTLSELTDHMSGEARRVAEMNKKYLEAEVDRTGDPFIKTKIYALIAQQIEISLLSEVKENFAFKVLDPPRVPDRKKGPRRGPVVAISFVAALLLGIFAAFGREFLIKQKSRGMEA